MHRPSESIGTAFPAELISGDSGVRAAEEQRYTETLREVRWVFTAAASVTYITEL